MTRGLTSEWARLAVDTIVRAGVRHAVVSPGSRSTPFIHALAERGDVVLHAVIDERSAAFFALGLARVSGEPALLCCTSGSAPAHYLPALIEAQHARVPLLVLSADRPLSLADCGAAQTIDQTALFGRQVRAFVDLGAPADDDGALAALQRRLTQAVHASLAPEPGPVHVNARADKPLEPGAVDPGLAARVHARIVEGPGRFSAARSEPDPECLGRVARSLLAAERPLILVGPGWREAAATAAPLALLARRLGAAVYCEAASGLRCARGLFDAARVDALAALLGAPRRRAEVLPDAVLQIGGAPVAAEVLSWMAHTSAPLTVLAAHGAPDPTNRAVEIVSGDEIASVRGLARCVSESPGAPRPYGARLAEIDAHAWSVIDGTLGPDLGEPEAVRDVADSLVEGDLLVLGNSLPVREMDLWARGRPLGLAVATQRGASGIDGNIAAAVGSAVASQRHTVLLLGDVACVHDVGSLLVLRDERPSLDVVVIDNGGGRIFEQLPVATSPAAARLDLWTTPHGVPLGHAAALYGLPLVTPRTRAELRAALANRSGGPRLVHVVVPPSSARDGRARLLQRLDEAAP